MLRSRLAVKLRLFAPYLAFALILGAVAPIAWPTEGFGDAFQFWYAGHLVVSGGSPYDQEAWGRAGALYGDLARNVVSNCSPTPYQPECLWVYPPHTAWLFAPFGLLDATVGQHLLEIFFFAVAVAGVLAIGWWVRTRSATVSALALSSFVASQPFFFEVHAGHFDGLGVMGLLLVAVGLRAARALPVVLGVLLLSLKPHLYVLVAIVVLIVLVRRRAWRTISAVTLTLAAVTLIGVAAYPDALVAILGRAATKTGLGWSTTWSFASTLVPGLALVGIVAVFALAILALLVAIRYARPGERVNLIVTGTMALSLAVSPYVHPYDLMLTFPTFWLAYAIGERLAPLARRLILFAIMTTALAGSWLAIVVSRTDVSVTGLPGALPVAALVLLAVASWKGRVSRSDEVQVAHAELVTVRS